MATQISFYVTILSISLASIFFFEVNSTEITSFSITKFSSDQQNIILQGGAYAADEKLTLTNATDYAVGRALYSAPIQIWDSKTGNVADFTTSFTFVMTTDSLAFGDGLAFFIAPIDTKPGGNGGLLGVFNSHRYDPTFQTVAVEFDTFQNAWDLDRRHIGIDVNYIRSVSTTLWNWHFGSEANVVISFRAATNVLNVSLLYPNSALFTHSDIVQLRTILPEWVRVGFSASTGSNIARHEILSWSFRSELAGTSWSNQAAAA